MVGLVLLGIFVFLLAFGAPIAVCLGMSSVGVILVQGAGKPIEAVMSVLPRLCSSASSKFVLLAIPFFILSGNVMEKAGISGRLIDLAEKCLGHIKGGLVPGLMMGAGLVVVSLIVGRKMDLKVQPRASWGERWKAFKDAFFGLMMPVIILGGIYGGIFTPTEAAAVSVFYGLAVGVFIYREINFKKFIDILIDSCSTTATVMFITMGATLFAYVLTRARLDKMISDFMVQVTGGNWIVFFLIVNVVLLIAGCFLDSTSALYIFTPLFAPVAAALNINPIHLGVVMIVNLAIGLFTPPVGVNLYVACGIGDIKIEEISKGIIPCLIAEIVVLLLVTYVEPISLMFVR